MADKTRLHHYISKHPTLRGEYTQGDIQRNIETYGATINGKAVHNRLEWILPGQTVELNNWPKRQQGNTELIRVIADEQDFVVLFKPAGVVVHPGAGHTSSTLLDWVMKHIPGQDDILKQASDDDNAKKVAGIVHRLDKDTAGLIVVAKTLSAHTRLQNLFRARKVSKHYLAVLEGNLASEIEVKGYQCRDKRNPRFQKFFVNETEAINYDSQARYSDSIFTPIHHNSEENQTLVDVEIKTGRMHQIRIQAKHLEHPILNDSLYGSGEHFTSVFTELTQFVSPDQLQLVSYQIGIEGKTYTLAVKK